MWRPENSIYLLSLPTNPPRLGSSIITHQIESAIKFKNPWISPIKQGWSESLNLLASSSQVVYLKFHPCPPRPRSKLHKVTTSRCSSVSWFIGFPTSSSSPAQPSPAQPSWGHCHMWHHYHLSYPRYPLSRLIVRRERSFMTTPFLVEPLLNFLNLSTYDKKKDGQKALF